MVASQLNISSSSYGTMYPAQPHQHSFICDGSESRLVYILLIATLCNAMQS